MYAVTVTFELKPGTRERFLPLMLDNARMSLSDEPGCLQFDVCAGDDPAIVFLYEIYSNAEAFRIHLDSPHFKTFDLAVSDMVVRKQVNTFSEVMR
ncbi:putative quinol monooxygenase [Ruegeria arenilitoris]|uniref:Autoinducer-2 (AI-2) modifying protein LsrG n=1 Tax=Ruegeria arenilitoris TaxID=1173585 RepID=A0A238JU69_9RHOB|nr:putative quinol monooxygenase [Ruegeria arenilitoris]SMX34033.1 autoinducer-2 (AI-2) modifying protein LsrG [Ruegeria arenilitoris]